MELMRNLLGRFPKQFFSAATLILILWLTLAPKPLGEETPHLFPGADKVVHGLMFGFLVLMILLDWKRKNEWHPTSWKRVAAAITFSAALGAFIEVCQLEMNMGRGFEWGDIIADSAGALVCGTVWLYAQNLRSETSMHKKEDAGRREHK